MSGPLSPSSTPQPGPGDRGGRSHPAVLMIEAFLASARSDARRLFALLLLGGLLVLAVFDAVWVGTAAAPSGSLRLELRSGLTSRARVYFDTGDGFKEEESVSRPISAAPEAQTLFFPLPPLPVQHAQIVLEGSALALNLHAVSVVRDEDGSEVRAFEPESITGGEGVDVLTPNVEGLQIVTSSKATATKLQLPLNPPISLGRGAGAWAVRLLLVDVPLFALYALCAFVALFGWPDWSLFVPRWENLWALLARWFPDGWAALLFAVPVVCAVCGVAVLQRNSYYLEAEVTCDRPILMQFYFDTGMGYHESDSTRKAVPELPDFRKVRFPIPVGKLTGLRFDPAEGPVRMRVNSVAVRSAAEDWLGSQPLYTFNLRNLWPLQQMTELVHEDDGTIRLLVVDGANDPATKLDLPYPLSLGVNGVYVAARSLVFALGWLLLWIVAVEVGLRLPDGKLEGAAVRARAVWRRLSPAQAVWLVAAAGVVLSCYPVIFCGKSFASVNFEDGTYQLYQKFPTLPGTTDAALVNGHGADLGSMAWRAAPDGVLESRALFHDGELPLRDRYSGAGAPLLGQGGSMVGDPLHWLVLVFGGRAWAWDAKFLLAKLFFTAGVGLLVLATADCLPAALLLSFSAAFIGFFACRLNHPAYFSLCYAPWILLAWLEIARAAVWGRVVGWTVAWVLINWTELNSGSIPEAAALLVYLNLIGLLCLLLARHSVQIRFQRLLVVAAGGLVFCLLAAPVLALFFDAARSSIGGPGAEPFRQAPPGLFIGLFDDFFYRQLVSSEHHLAPAANFLVLSGVLLALSNAKRLLRDRRFVAVTVGTLLLIAAVFGGVPLEWVDKLPLVGTIARPDIAFSTVLLIPIFVVAGFGLRQCLLRLSRRQWTRDLLVAALIGGVMIAVFYHLLSGPVPGNPGAPKLDQANALRTALDGYVAMLVLAAAILPFALRRLALRGPAVAPVLLVACCLFLIHWRQGIQLGGTFGEYTPELPDRLDLLARSPAIDFLHADHAGPFRGVGLGANLMMGYNGIAGVESFNSPETFVSPYLAELKTTGMKFTGDWLTDSLDKARLAEVKRFYDLCNVRYYLALPDDSLADVPGLRLIGKLDLDVYRNETAWPRAFFVDRLQDYDGVEDYVREVMDGDAHPFAAIDRTEYLLEPALAGRFGKTPDGRTVVPAANYRLTGNGTSFDIEAPRAGVIVLTESFYPDAISARINGRPAPVFRVNHAFCGVVVNQPGPYRVSFAYRPAHFVLALVGALLGWCLLGVAGWRLFWKRPGPILAGPLEKSAPSERFPQEHRDHDSSR